MSFCCGASMIGTQGMLRHFQTYIRNVPILFCPVCRRVMVNPLIENEYELLAEYAYADGALEVDFAHHVKKDHETMFANCVHTELDRPQDIMAGQIDSALDLLAFASQIGDLRWMEQLKQRLRILSGRQVKLRRNSVANYPKLS